MWPFSSKSASDTKADVSVKPSSVLERDAMSRFKSVISSSKPVDVEGVLKAFRPTLDKMFELYNAFANETRRLLLAEANYDGFLPMNPVKQPVKVAVEFPECKKFVKGSLVSAPWHYGLSDQYSAQVIRIHADHTCDLWYDDQDSIGYRVPMIVLQELTEKRDCRAIRSVDEETEFLKKLLASLTNLDELVAKNVDIFYIQTWKCVPVKMASWITLYSRVMQDETAKQNRLKPSIISPEPCVYTWK